MEPIERGNQGEGKDVQSNQFGAMNRLICQTMQIIIESLTQKKGIKTRLSLLSHDSKQRMGQEKKSCQTLIL